MKLVHLMPFLTVLISSCSTHHAVDLVGCAYTPMKTTFSKCQDTFQELQGKKDRRSHMYSMHIEKVLELDVLSGERFPIFHLQANGLAKNQKFKIVHRNALGKLTKVFEGIYLGGGKLKSIQGTHGQEGKVITYWPICIGCFHRGEPSELLLVNPKEKTTNAVFYLPFPEEAVIKDGVKITKLLTNLCPLTYMFGIESLTPGESIEFKSVFDSEKSIARVNVPESGDITAIVDTHIKKGSGEADFEIQRDSGSIKIKYPWNTKSHLPVISTPLIILTVDHPPSCAEIKKAILKFFSKVAGHNLPRLEKALNEK